MKQPTRRFSFLRFFRPSWYLDALMFWSVFCSGTILILFVFNNTTKFKMRESMEKRVLSATQLIAATLSTQIDETSPTDSSQPQILHSPHVRELVRVARREMAIVYDVWIATGPSENPTLLYLEGDEWVPLHEHETTVPNLSALVSFTRTTSKPTGSDWNFLKHQVFFFFTPEPDRHEYIATALSRTATSQDLPVVIVLFDTEPLYKELSSVDLNTFNILSISILLATAISLLMRRRSIQREEAIEEKLNTLQLLRKRDRILAATVAAADVLFHEKEIQKVIARLLQETAPVLHAESVYYLSLHNTNQPAHIQLETTGSWPAEAQPLPPCFLDEPFMQSIRSRLQSGHEQICGETETAQLAQQYRLTLRHLTLIPVVSTHHLIAVIVLAHSRESTGEEQGVLATLQLAARLIGTAITRIESEMHLRQSSKMEALGRMAGGVAHEFNNLLHIVSGNLSVLSGRLEGQPTHQELVQKMLRAAQKGSKIIDQLLKATRQHYADLQPANLNDILERTLVLAESALPKTIRIHQNLATGLPNTLLDETLIQQVILNLILNARDALHGEGTIHIETGANAAAVYCRISDSGPGIPPEIIDSIFDPFFTTKPPGVGTGLGLSTSRGILEQHNGSLEATNRTGGGAQFTFTLPISDSLATPSSSPTDSTLIQSQPSGIVLVADDEPLCLDLACDILSEAGFQIIRARDGRELLNQAREQAASIQWVISDWSMPGPPNPQLLHDLRAILPGAKIILTSGFLLEDQQPPSVDAILKKPFEPAELTGLMKQLQHPHSHHPAQA